MVSPLIIRIGSEKVEAVGKKAGTIYAISTLGGILMTFGVAFYSIPELGLATSSYATAGLLLAATVISFIAPPVTSVDQRHPPDTDRQQLVQGLLLEIRP